MKKKYLISGIIVLILLILFLIFNNFFNNKNKDSTPVINLLGEEVVTLKVGNDYKEKGATAHDELDGDLTDKIIIDNKIDLTKPGTYKIIYYVENSLGKSYSVERIVKVVEEDVDDTTAPEITILGNNPQTVALNSTYTDAGATAYDDIDGEITNLIITTGDVDTSNVGTYYITYTVLDNAGNKATATREVKVVQIKSEQTKDTTKPVITILGNNPMNIQRGSYFSDPGATASDNIDGNITNKIKTTGTVDTNKVGTYYITYTVSDNAGNTTSARREVNVLYVDTLKPEITLLGDNPYQIHIQEKYIEPGATAYDKDDGNITNKIKITGTVDTNKLGTYYITYTVSDKAGNTTSVKREVNVIYVDKEKPEITLLGDNPHRIYEQEEYIEPGATAYDKDDGDITDKIKITGTVDTNIPGTYFITYTVSDKAGNTTSVKREVNILAFIGYNKPAPAQELDECIPIEDGEDLNDVRDDLDGVFCLKNDIDMSLYQEWEPIGTEENPFTGEIWGGNYYIENLDIESETSLSLFGEVENAKFNNLNFKDINITTNDNTAIIANKMSGNLNEINDSKIENTVSLETTNDTGLIGGFVNELTGGVNIFNSYAEFIIKDSLHGGLFISNANSDDEVTIRHSSTIPTIENNTIFGGFVGLVEGTDVGVYNSLTKLNGSSEALGGMLGRVEDNNELILQNLKVEDALIENNIKESGGILGYSNVNSIFIDNIVVNNFKANNTAGIIGGVAGSVIGDANIANINVSKVNIENATGDDVGSMFGMLMETKTLSGLTAKEVTITNSIKDTGGLVGIAMNPMSSEFIDINNIDLEDININSDTNTGTVGGAFGSIRNLKEFSNIEAKGITIQSTIDAGGLIGTIVSSEAEIDNVLLDDFDLIITGESKSAAGLIGTAFGIETLSNVIARNILIEAPGSSTGGLLGFTTDIHMNATDIDLENIEIKGTSQDVGGLAGYMNGAKSIQNINLKNIYVEGENNIGGIIGQLGSGFEVIDNIVLDTIQINSDGKLRSGGGMIGGIFAPGQRISKVRSSNIDIKGTDLYAVGGLIGGTYGTHELDMDDIEVDDVYILNINNDEGRCVGGLVGEQTAIKSYTNFDIKNIVIDAPGISTVGGITGFKAGNILIDNITVDNINITGGTFFVAGLFAHSVAPNMTSNLDVKNITINQSEEETSVGGIYGQVSNLTMEEVVVENLTMENAVGNQGGIIGDSTGTVDMKNVELDLSVVNSNEGASNHGAVIGGANFDITLDNITVNGTLNVNGNNAGGLIGYGKNNVKILNSIVNVDLTGNYSVGGFVGYASGDVELNNNTFTGNIIGNLPLDIETDGGIGGMFGYLGGNISAISSTSNAIITADDYIGGIVGIVNYAEPLTDLDNLIFAGSIISTGTNIDNKVGYYVTP